MMCRRKEYHPESTYKQQINVDSVPNVNNIEVTFVNIGKN